ncbi:hypothetical protein [Sinorhizobium sp. BJ1]|uniref:hypothetical protein n=1 Tax=Sinorhizobium sp. BJ1 TaxID=2035455 RepID=UPI000BE9AD65|nr:hypothetical protein [Sinorhizobium sp. BJ1]PDT80359.1 hypothetical protein CO676_28170 [Sinorhizobium sp. BJ1]
MSDYQRAVLRAALEDIDNLAAPRNLDEVCRVLSLDLVDFAKLGQFGMKAVVQQALEGIAMGRLPSRSASRRFRHTSKLPVAAQK